MALDVDCLENPHSNVQRPSPTLPAELLDRIIELALQFPSSARITNLSLFAASSWLFRSLAFRHFYRHIQLSSESQVKRIFTLLASLNEKTGEDCSTWIRSLCAPSKTLLFHSAQLGALTHLETLSIDLYSEGLVTQHPCLKRICLELLSSPIENASHKLTMLTLTSLPHLDVPLLRLIGNNFPCLIDLHLSCTERLDLTCCWHCYEESLGLTIHSPIPEVYPDSTAMIGAFASVLRLLTQLTHLHLGIYLSDENLIPSHIDHGERERQPPFGPEECIICDEAAAEIQLRELAAGLQLAQYLKALRTVGFSSFFDDSHSDSTCGSRVSGRQDRTTVYVLRANGRIRVKKVPHQNVAKTRGVA
ncbi:hypothetical protein C8R43DRAFT_884454 [Mycena crocata]|nr:hypothetical protein C8R43DRAFT_884454 [Mycena crocata]